MFAMTALLYSYYDRNSILAMRASMRHRSRQVRLLLSGRSFAYCDNVVLKDKQRSCTYHVCMNIFCTFLFTFLLLFLYFVTFFLVIVELMLPCFQRLHIPFFLMSKFVPLGAQWNHRVKIKISTTSVSTV